jgi:hypothetical protein
VHIIFDGLQFMREKIIRLRERLSAHRRVGLPRGISVKVGHAEETIRAGRKARKRYDRQREGLLHDSIRQQT